jgi:uncharacterized membrane protein
VSDRALRAASSCLALAGAGLAAYLLYVQLHEIGAVCDWCLASDAVTALLAVLGVLRLSKLAA